MIRRIEIRNFKCFDRFVFQPDNRNASLIIGRNGSGKSTIGEVLFALAQIASGINTVSQQFSPVERYDQQVPQSSFSGEFLVNGKVYDYAVELTVSPDGRTLSVSSESLTVNQDPLYTKDATGNVTMYPGGTSYFDPSDHFALPLINNPSPDSDIEVFKRFCRNILFLKVWPLLMRSETDETKRNADVAFANFASWYLDRVTEIPGVYAETVQTMQRFVPEFNAIVFTPVAANSKRMMVRFSDGGAETLIPMAALSDGEKCLLVMSAIGAVNRQTAPVLCFWDEPDNFLSKSEVAAAVTELANMFQRRGQLIITTHDDEAIVKFDRDNTFVFERQGKLVPVRGDVRTLARVLDEDGVGTDLRTSLRMGDVDS